VLEFEQQLAPSAALSGRDFFIPGPQAATPGPSPAATAENSVEHVIAAADFTVAWRRDIGAGSGRTRQIMAPVVADSGRVFVLDGESTVSALDAASGASRLESQYQA
jgi:outer membrane protein assembly factor BamB